MSPSTPKPPPPEGAADPEGTAGHPGVSAADPEGAADHPEGTAGHLGASAADPDTSAADPGVSVPDSSASAPDPESAADQPGTSAPDSSVSAPDPSASATDPEGAALAEARGARYWLPRFAVTRPITVLMSLAAALVTGVLAWQMIPVQLMPSGFTPPFMFVSVPTLPGAPADHERTVAEPIESAIATLPGLKTMRTSVRAEQVGIRIELEAEVDVDVAYDQIRDRLDRELPLLPEGSRQAFIFRHDPDEQPLFILGVVYPPGAENPYQTLTDRVARPLERQLGVSRVEVAGVRPMQVRVDLHDAALRVHGLDGADVVRILQQDHFTMALGAIEPAGQRVLVRALARFSEIEQLRQRPLVPGVLLGDVANVHFGTDPDPEIHRVDGQPAATVMVYKESTANTIETAEAIALAVQAVFREDPHLAGWSHETFFDQGSYISESIAQLRDSALLGGLIAVIVLFLFLRALGMTLLVTLSIPMCLLSAVVVLAFTGDSLNVMSMMGLMLGVGMVVDNAIVVLENIDRHRTLGAVPRVAALLGAGEVALAISLATLTTIVVFLPLILLASHPTLAFFLGKIGFPVCYALLASLVVALIYIPAGARLLKNTHSEAGRISQGFIAIYGRLLAWVLSHRLAASLSFVGLILSLYWPAQRVQRVDQVQAGIDSVRMRLVSPATAGFEEIDAVLRDLEAQLIAQKDQLDMRAILAQASPSRSRGSLQLFFKPMDERQHERTEVTARLRRIKPKNPDFSLRIGWQGTDGDEGGIPLSVMGPDTDLATEVAQELIGFVQKLPAVEAANLDDTDDTTELRFVVDREAADRAGVSAMDVGATLDYTLRGRRLADFPTVSGEIQLVVGLDPADRADSQQLSLLQVRPRLTRTSEAAVADPTLGTQVLSVNPVGGPLDLLAPTVRSPGYGQISRTDRRTQVVVRVMGDEGQLFGVLRNAVEGLSLPAGYQVDFGSRFGRRTENEAGGAFALLLAVVLVFLVMGVLFESFLLPLSILACIPLAFTGVAWTLYLTDTPLDVMAIVGSIILVGVVVNNGIVLIDQVQQRRAAGEARTHALIEGAKQRFRPILMTALTTIAGLVPMAVGRASLLGMEYYPLGRVVIGGMITGTFLTLLAVPLFYSLLDDARFLPHRIVLLLRAAAGRLRGRAAAQS